MIDKFPCCVCPLEFCEGSDGCPFTHDTFAFEEGILKIVNSEIPNDIPKEEVSNLLLKNCKKMSKEEVNLLISQIY